MTFLLSSQARRRCRSLCGAALRTAAWAVALAAGTSTILAGEPEALRALRERARTEQVAPRPSAAVQPPAGLESLAVPFPEAGGLRDTDLAGALGRLKPTPANPAPAAEPVDEPTLRQSIRLYVRGQTALVENNLADAMKDLGAAGELNPGAPEPWELLAQAQGRAGRVREAVASLRQAYEAGSVDPGTLMTYWRALRLDRRWEESAQVAQRLRETAGASNDVGLAVIADAALGESLLSMGAATAGSTLIAESLDAAERVSSPRWVEESSELVRRRSELWMIVGDARLRLGKLSEALAAYENAKDEPGPDAGGLMERRVYAMLRAGLVAGAAALVVDDRAANVAGNPERTGALIRAVGAADPESAGTISNVLVAIADDPDTKSATRRVRLLRAAAAGLEPEPARALLLSRLEGLPDRGLVDDLLGRMAPQDRAQALTLAGEALNRAPALLDRVSELVARNSNIDALVETRARLTGTEGRPGVDAVVASLQLRASRFDDARRTGEEGDRAYAGDPRWMLWRAKIAAACADWGAGDRAMAVLAAAADRDPRSAVLAARGLSTLQRPQEALAMYERALAALGDGASVSELLGAADLAQWLGREALSESYVIRAASADTQAEAPRLRLLETAGWSEDPDRERLSSMIRELREIAPNARGLRLIRGRELIRAGQYIQALGEYSSLLAEDPEDDDAGAGLLRVATALPTTDPALVRLRTRVQQLRDAARSSAWPALTDGALAIRTAKDETSRRGAGAALDSVLESHYDGDVLRLWAALTREALGNEAGARRVLEMLAKYPANADVVGARAAARTQLGDLAGASGELDLLPASTSLRPAQASALISALEPRAEAAVEGIGQPNAPATGPVRVLLNQVFARASRLSPALHGARLDLMVTDREFDMPALVKAAQDAAEQIADPGAVHRRVIKTFDKQGMRQAAVEFARLSALEEAPGSSALHVLWMTVAANWGSAEDAAAAVRAACGPGRLDATVHELVNNRRNRPTANVEPADIAYEVASTLAVRGLDDATLLYELALEYDPGHKSANNDLGYTLLERDERRADAARMIEIAHKADPNDSNLLDSYGWLRYLQGRFVDDNEGPGAVTILQRAVENDSDSDPSATVRDHLGDALYRAGDLEAAKRAWGQAESAAGSWLHRNRTANVPGWLIKKYVDVQDSAHKKQAAIKNQNNAPIAPTWAEIDGAKRARADQPEVRQPAPASPDGENR